MTEEEAKTKWCPHVRHYNARFQPCGNSMAGAMPDHRRDGWPNNCIGSACMAWRWNEPVCRHKERGSFHSPEMASKHPDDFEMVPPGGYCGLAERA